MFLALLIFEGENENFWVEVSSFYARDLIYYLIHPVLTVKVNLKNNWINN